MKHTMSCTKNMTEILAVIGGITLIRTAAARIPAALAEFLRACILVATAARELRTALTERSPLHSLAQPRNGRLHRTPGISRDDSGQRVQAKEDPHID